MAKEKTKKAPAVEAPIVENAPKNKTTKTPAKVDVVQMGDLDKIKQSYAKNGGLDSNHRVDVLMGIKTYFKDDPNAAQNTGVPQEAVDKINAIAAIGFVAALGDEILMGPSGWARKMRMTQIEAINSVNDITGITIDVKALPAPDENGEVDVPDKAVKVTSVTKKRLEAENKTSNEAKEKKYLSNHTLIENEDQLKEALGFQLVNNAISSPIERLITAAQFYRSYLEARAEKSDNTEAELSKIHELSLAELLQDITTMVPPTFVTEGFGKVLYRSVTNAQNIVPAFNMFKRASTKRDTGVCKFSDEEIAAMVRVLTVWNCSNQIAEISKSIKDCNKNIETLSKDAKANAKAIDGEKNKIEAKTAAIKSIQDIISLTTEPGFDIADNFIAAYNHEDNPLHKQAKLLFNSMIETYYKGVEVTELEFDALLLNIQQRIGATLNLFNSSVGKRDEYSLDNIAPAGFEPNGNTGDDDTKNS